MDNSGYTDRLSEMDESDLTTISMLQMEMDMPMAYDELEVLKSSVMNDLNDNQPNDDDFDHANLDLESCYDMSPDWLDIFDDPVLNDKMMTEASTHPVVKSEHSYSIGKMAAPAEVENSLLALRNDTLSRRITLDEHTGPTICPKLLEVDSLKSVGAQAKPRAIQTVTVTKQEPRIIVKNEPIIIEARRPPQQQSLLKPSSILLTKTIQPRTDITTTMTTLNTQRYEMMTTQQMSDDMDEGIYLNVMPLTPPGSSSDSDGGNSPRESPTPSPIRQVVFKSSHREVNPATAIYSQPVSLSLHLPHCSVLGCSLQSPLLCVFMNLYLL
ncbi:hypothetical protein EB796_012407 [Bugula neritina]|uniref:Uncharacterized protein n=1 Tax=Bugula neritina TaxID=10212 RepID=A0A7J7JVE4_BUGNE|nr:hypothetical protein EB796_012407 [Bugula neritina]